MAQDRTDKSIKNIKYALIGQALNIVIHFAARIIFVRILGKVFLGANGVFTNIVSVLALAELGIGNALVFALYEPLAKDDIKKVKQLMHLYKVSYIVIGALIAAMGLAFSPFLGFFIKEGLPTGLFVPFMLFVLTSSVSYLYSYKSALLIADQKRYVVVKYQYGFFITMTALQTVFLYITRNYILYLVIRLFFTGLEQYMVFRKADKEYPYLKEPVEGKLDDETKHGIVRNIRAMIVHKISGVVVLSTDNLIITRMIDVVVVGIYSNYTLIITTLNTFIEQIFSSLIASIGNLYVTESTEHSMEVFDTVFFMCFWIFGFSSICLICLFNPFIYVCFGEDFLFSLPIVLTLVVNFYIMGMRSAAVSFNSAYGLYWQKIYIPISEVIINLITSIILCKYIGTIGVFLGTTISMLTTRFWGDPVILYTYGFKSVSSIKGYLFKYFKFTGLEVIIGVCCYALCSVMPFGVWTFFARVFICLVFPNSVFVILFRHTKEYGTLKGIVKRKLLKQKTA